MDTIRREASEWLAAQSLGALDAARHREFQAWWARDRRHAETYAKIAELWASDSITHVLRELEVERHGAARRPGRVPPVSRFGRFAAAAAVLAALSLGAHYATRNTQGSAPNTYATTVAEIREIKLADGSVVTLGANSRITVDIAADDRHVQLLAGEAFFSVARDPARPFSVDVGDARIEVLGTRFEVSLAPGGVRVSVAEGVVELIRPALPVATAMAPETTTAPSATTAPVAVTANGDAPGLSGTMRTTLHKGEQLITAPDRSAEEIAPIEVDVPGAWRRGRLVYLNAPLEEVLADARRYYAGRIVLDEPALGALRVTATFGSDDIAAMIRLLGEQMPLEVEWRRNGDIVLLASRER
jgi:transmembrane sensor